MTCARKWRGTRSPTFRCGPQAQGASGLALGLGLALGFVLSVLARIIVSPRDAAILEPCFLLPQTHTRTKTHTHLHTHVHAYIRRCSFTLLPLQAVDELVFAVQTRKVTFALELCLTLIKPHPNTAYPHERYSRLRVCVCARVRVCVRVCATPRCARGCARWMMPACNRKLRVSRARAEMGGKEYSLSLEQ